MTEGRAEAVPQSQPALNSVDASLSNLGIVLRIHTRHADAASVDHDRDATFDQRRPAHGEIFQSYTAARHRVFERLL